MNASDTKQLTEEEMGEAKRREEAEAARRTTPFIEAQLDKNAKEAVDSALLAMGILANKQDNFGHAVSVVRAVAATAAMMHIAPDDRVQFFKYVGKHAAAKLVTNEAAPRILVPGRG